MHKLQLFSQTQWPHIAWQYLKMKLGLSNSFQQYDQTLTIWAKLSPFVTIATSQGDALALSVKQLEKRFQLTLRKNTSDIQVCEQIFSEESYKAPSLLAQEKLSKVTTIVDAGANIGLASLYFHAYFPNAHIYSLEPDQSNFKQAEENVALNQLQKSIHLLPFALWHQSSSLDLNTAFRDGLHWSVQVEESDSGSIRGVTLQELMTLEKIDSIDILKIDIEGAERFLFADEAFALDMLSKVKLFCIEIHEEYIAPETICQILEKAGFVYFTSGELTIAHKL